MHDPVDLFSRATDEFDRRVASVTEDQWHLRTPCEDWDVRALVQHVVYEAVWTPPLLEGATVEEVGDRFEGDLLGPDPSGAWVTARAAAVGAAARPGAMVDTVHLSYADVAGAEYLLQLTTDMAVHAWDLARGIGADEGLDADIVRACLEQVERDEEAIRSSGLFGRKVEVPADASAQTRLLAILGRAG